MSEEVLIEEHLGMVFLNCCEFIQKHLKILHLDLQTAWSKESSEFAEQDFKMVHSDFWVQQKGLRRWQQSIPSINLKLFLSQKEFDSKMHKSFSGSEMAVVPFYMRSRFQKKSWWNVPVPEEIKPDEREWQ